MSSNSRTPSATYRLQLREGMDFERAGRVAEYLAELGISHVYLSPIWEAAPGSTHGYDVTDPNAVDPALGGEAGRRAFLAVLDNLGLGHLLDIVPNHMSVASERNRWWWDVLEYGPTSQYARAFDVDWAGPTDAARDKVLLPILSERYGRALKGGKLRIVRDGGQFRLFAMGRKLPLSAESIGQLLLIPARSADIPELELLADALYGARTGTDSLPDPRRKDLIFERLQQLFETRPEVARAVDGYLAELEGQAEALDELISLQHYRLAHYKVARYDLDYRRFFDVAELAALSVDTASVFEDTHRRVFEWRKSGELNALRVDHPDGLRDPARYFERLRASGDAVWIVAEKILAHDELVPDDWPIDGTTGYDFLNMVGGLYVDAKAEPQLDATYAEFLGKSETVDLGAQIRQAKRYVLDQLLASDLRRLTLLLQQLLTRRLEYRDFAFEELRLLLREALACLEVYRTYVRPASPRRIEDAAYLSAAFERAQRERPELDPELVTFLRELLSGAAQSETEWDFVQRFQQLSAATMAKGLEDTAFYRSARLLSLNEVGHDPKIFSVGVERFHTFCTLMQERWPKSLLATTTHDTKRSEDARLRLSALSERPELWRESVQRWSRLAREVAPEPRLDRNMEYVLWQTLVAAHPISEPRLSRYLTKAMREAKLETSWLDPNSAYEDAVIGFARGVLGNSALMAELDAFVAKLLPTAWHASLSQTLLKLTAYGVPDIYQGSELWDTRLTDPDNRSPVDFEQLEKTLARATRASVEEALADFQSGLPKLWMTQRVLGLRRLEPEWFGPEAGYRPLAASGSRADQIVAFARGTRVVVVAPRLFSSLLENGYADTSLPLPPGSYRNLFDSDSRYSGRVELSELLHRFPVALLIGEGLA